MAFKISQNAQERTFVGVSFLIKLQALSLRHRLSFANLLKTPFSQNTFRRVFLIIIESIPNFRCAETLPHLVQISFCSMNRMGGGEHARKHRTKRSNVIPKVMWNEGGS